jgi:hypothetical protein
VSTPDPVDARLGDLFTAWVRDIDSEPVADLAAAALRSDHTPTHDLAGL